MGNLLILLLGVLLVVGGLVEGGLGDIAEDGVLRVLTLTEALEHGCSVRVMNLWVLLLLSRFLLSGDLQMYYFAAILNLVTLNISDNYLLFWLPRCHIQSPSVGT